MAVPGFEISKCDIEPIALELGELSVDPLINHLVVKAGFQRFGSHAGLLNCRGFRSVALSPPVTPAVFRISANRARPVAASRWLGLYARVGGFSTTRMLRTEGRAATLVGRSCFQDSEQAKPLQEQSTMRTMRLFWKRSDFRR